MPSGAITSYIDVAQVALYAFWIFFAVLIWYLRREDKREGYPLESERSPHVRVQGFPSIPGPKRFVLPHGGEYMAPNGTVDKRELAARPSAPWLGAPLEPTGASMLAAVGPGAYAMRADTPDLTVEGHHRIVPLRVATDHGVLGSDPDPRGMAVVGADGEVGGTVRDLWIDRAEPQIRYLEVETAGAKRVLLPVNFSKVDARRGQVKVRAILGKHFADVPALKDADRVTRLEEERIVAYYGGGTLYAVPSRMGPFL
jgi:photosynthetic reaction center H subunit